MPRGLTSLSGKVLKGVLIPRGRRWGSAGRATGEEAFSRENRKSGGLGDLGETGNGLALPTELETSHWYPPYEMVSRQLLSSGTPAAEKSPLLRLWTEAADEAWTVWRHSEFVLSTATWSPLMTSACIRETRGTL